MTTKIINDLMYDRGRGPELRSCRITVYDLIPYLESEHYSNQKMLELWTITSAELEALKEYIADHREEVMAVHHRIEERIQRQIEAQNTPEFRAQFAANEGRIAYYPTWLRDREREAAAGGPPLPDTGPERLAEYAAWWRANRNAIKNDGVI